MYVHPEIHITLCNLGFWRMFRPRDIPRNQGTVELHRSPIDSIDSYHASIAEGLFLKLFLKLIFPYLPLWTQAVYRASRCHGYSQTVWSTQI